MHTIEGRVKQVLDEVSKIKQPHTVGDAHLIDLVIAFVKDVILWKNSHLDVIEKEIGTIKEEIAKVEKRQTDRHTNEPGKT